MATLEPSLASYVRSVNRIPRLSRERELELAEAWAQRGDTAARDELLQAHLRYVVTIALKYQRYGVPMGELIGEGNVGVVHALIKFDPSRGFRFVTYAAHWIRAFVLDHVIRSWSLVGGGSGVLRSKVFFRLRRERARIANLVGDGPAAENLLSARMGIPVDKLVPMLQRLDVRDVSLDAKSRDDGTTTLLDSLPGSHDQEKHLANVQESQLLSAALREAVSTLDQREQFIVERRLMADDEAELSLADIGRYLGVSRERVRQLEMRTKKKLKRWLSESLTLNALLPELGAAT